MKLHQNCVLDTFSNPQKSIYVASLSEPEDKVGAVWLAAGAGPLGQGQELQQDEILQQREVEHSTGTDLN